MSDSNWLKEMKEDSIFASGFLWDNDERNFARI